jgi:WD40 repeat protein
MKISNLIIAVLLILSFRYASAQISRKYSGNTDYVHAVTFSPGGKYIASGGYDEIIRIWDIESGNLVNSINTNNKIFKLYFDTDAKKIIAGNEPLAGISSAIDSFVFVYDAFGKKGNELLNVQSKSPNFFVQRNGNKAVSVIPELFLDSCKYIVNYNIENDMEGKCYKLLLNNYDLSSVTFESSSFLGMIGSWDFNYPVTISENGKFLALYSQLNDKEKDLSSNYKGNNRDTKTIKNKTGIMLYIFDIENKKMITRTILLENNLGQKTILMSNDGSYFYYVSREYLDDAIKILDVKQDKDIEILTGHTKEILCLAMHPGGHFIASGSRDNTIRIWDINTGKEVKVLEGNGDNVNYIAFSPDGRYLASASDDNSVRIWDLTSISKDIEVYALKYNIDEGLKKYISEIKNEELRKLGNSEYDRKSLDEKYSQKYIELYNKTLEEYNKILQ